MTTAGQRGTVLLRQALVDDRAAILDAAITYLEQAVRETPAGDVNALAWRSNLAAALRTRYTRRGDRRDLDTAVDHVRQIVAETAPDDSNLPNRQGNLGRVIYDRYLLAGENRDLDEAITMLQAAADTTSGSALAGHATNLGSALLDRFERRRDAAAVEAAVDWQRKAVAEDDESPQAWANLSAALHVRFQVRRDQDDLDEAFVSAETAVVVAGPRHPGRSIYLTNVGVLQYTRYTVAGAPEDLEAAISSLAEAVEAEDSAGPSARAERLTALANCHRERHLRHGDIAELDIAIRYHREAVDLTPETSPERPVRLSGLATALGERPSSCEGPDRLAEALRLHAEAVRLAEPDHASLAQIVANHGSCLLTLFERHQNLDDCSAAIDRYERAVRLAGADHPERPVYLASLGQALRARHATTGDPADLHRAVDASRAAVTATAVDHRHYSSMCSYLGAALRSRYIWYGEQADLDEAVTWLDTAVAAAPVGHLDRAAALAGRALALRHRATYVRSEAQDAVDASREALDAETNMARRPLRLAMLGSALDLLPITLDNLNETIAVRGESCELSATDDPELGQRLTNLGNSLRERARLTGDRDDLDEAHRHHLRALDLINPADPEYAILLSNLAGSFRDRYVRDGDQADLVSALERLRQAAELSAAPAMRRFVAARTWAMIASQTDQWDSAMTGYATAISLLPVAAWHGIDRAARQQLLRESRWLAADAAAVVLRHGSPIAALDLLEQGRAVQWTQRLALATDLDRVQAAAPELARRLEHARAILDHVDTEEPRIPTSDARIRAAAEWDDAMAELSDRPDLFAPARSIADQLETTPLSGTVVVVNVSRFGCDAILVRAQGIRPIELDRLDLADLAEQVESYLDAIQSLFDSDTADAGHAAENKLADVLSWLWDAVASTVLAELPPGERVWWCPTGPFTYLPLHAAGQVPDRTISSYTPTIRALLRATAASPATTRVLGVAVPESPGAVRLPGASREIALMEQQLRPVTEVTTLCDGQADRQRVRQALTEHGWAHLACHAEHDLAQPDRSALLLADGPLALTQLTIRDGYHAEGAYLSACRTAFGAVDLTDEALNLAAALQYGGFRRVIGTLWPVRDAIAQSVARRVYSVLCDHVDFRPERSAHAVSDTTRWLRDRYPPTIHRSGLRSCTTVRE